MSAPSGKENITVISKMKDETVLSATKYRFAMIKTLSEKPDGAKRARYQLEKQILRFVVWENYISVLL